MLLRNLHPEQQVVHYRITLKFLIITPRLHPNLASEVRVQILAVKLCCVKMQCGVSVG